MDIFNLMKNYVEKESIDYTISKEEMFFLID